MSKAKLSILIPIYNVSRFLPTCLDSVISQTLDEIEIICINDGSTDDCGEILSDYAEKDSRIKVINKPNTGYGHSMNIGLENATGEYVGIVESDDYVAPDYFDKLYRVAKEHELDIAKAECTFTWPSADYDYVEHNAWRQKYYGQIISKDRLWLRCQFMMNIWAGIYMRNFLEEYNIRFNETPGASYQDNGFWMQGMIFADRVMFTDDPGYYYRQDNSFQSVKDPQKVYAMVDEYEWLANHLKDRLSGSQMDVVNAFRLTRGYWSFFRIDDSRKREFCDRLISDYVRYGDVLSTNLRYQELFYQVISDPDEFCCKVIETKRDIEDKIHDATSLIIYGAGRRGQRLYRLFCDMGFKDKLQCFVESSAPQIKSISRVPVYEISSDAVDWDNSLVVISAADESGIAKEMSEKLKDMDITNVMGSDGFFYSYYTLT